MELQLCLRFVDARAIEGCWFFREDYGFRTVLFTLTCHGTQGSSSRYYLFHSVLEGFYCRSRLRLVLGWGTQLQHAFASFHIRAARQQQAPQTHVFVARPSLHSLLVVSDTMRSMVVEVSQTRGNLHRFASARTRKKRRGQERTTTARTRRCALSRGWDHPWRLQHWRSRGRRRRPVAGAARRRLPGRASALCWRLGVRALALRWLRRRRSALGARVLAARAGVRLGRLAFRTAKLGLLGVVNELRGRGVGGSTFNLSRLLTARKDMLDRHRLLWQALRSWD